MRHYCISNRLDGKANQPDRTSILSEGKRTSEGGGLEEENEDIEVLEYSSQEIEDLLENGQVKDLKTIYLLNSIKNIL